MQIHKKDIQRPKLKQDHCSEFSISNDINLLPTY